MKKLCDSTSDVISNLPGFILDNILTGMPLRDAVRTSVLSKKWRYNWASIPQLVFDDNVMTLVPGHDKSQTKLMLIISQVLMRHPEPILKFTLSIRELEGCPEIDNLISFLTSKGVEELTLQIWKGEGYKLPSSLFSCNKLTHLNLRCCNFTPPATFEGFGRLVCLELCEVIISKDAFERLISACPMLEQLRLESSVACDRLEIDSDSLKRSYFIGNFKSISFKNASHLAVVSLLSKEPASKLEPTEGDSFDWFGFLTNVPALQNLELDKHYLKSLAMSMLALKMQIVSSLRRLESLRLYGICLDHPLEIGAALSLMICSEVREVTIEVKSNGQNVQGREFLRRCGILVFNKLRDVQLGITSGTAVELEFIKLLLAQSCVLEKMVVKPETGRVTDGGLKILSELAEFERLSPKVKVMYKDPDLTEAGERKF